ncbi:site-specific integrase [Sulfurovum indicum]|uniref:Site-specific integrase n=1 Tax=Sulfurovum indicum TaxID=2779528 RepID=A0A7M1S350_9BACT|nr:site-specific integrase [Sulfurovum indicum]QOR61169.1 site-specific integrase [Sulfurovum indicum]
MTYNARFEKLLPTINISDEFLIIEDAYTTLGEDWLAYVKHTLSLAFKKDTKFKTIRDAVKKPQSLLSLSDKAKNLLGMGEDFCVIDIDIDRNNQIKVTPIMGYDELIKIYFSSEKQKVHGMGVKAIIDRFFGYQWGKKKLLYPIKKVPEGYQRPDNWNEMIMETELSVKLTTWFTQQLKGKAKANYYHRRQALNRVLSATTWYTLSQISDRELTLLRDAIVGNEHQSDGRRTNEFDILIINDLRYMLIDSGRDDITPPRDIAREKRSDYFGEGSSLDERFEWVDTERFPNLTEIKEKAYDYIHRLKIEGAAAGTINGKATAVNNFFRFLMDVYPFEKIDIDRIDESFEPGSSKSLLGYLEEVRSSRESAITELYKIIQFLVHCELYSAKSRKNTPQQRKKAKREPYRDAMPKEMVAHIVEILKNRPPNSTTRWNRYKADSSWWEHDVYPVYPMMMLFGYYIPIRGEQVRNLCRENSFVFDSYGKIERFVINTDKNVNKRYLHEVPCVWDDLQAFVPFLKWHKEYFPHLSKVKYHNDDNSPWEDIVPLMITPQVLRPMSKKTHMDYHKRVLCQYQIEVMEKAKKEGHSNYPVVAWRKDKKPFFKSVEELNRASSTAMDNIGISYDIHSLRVTGATRYLEAGVGIKTVMDLTGHASAETLIRIYVQLTREEKEQTLRSAAERIFFGKKEDLIENTDQLIRGEFVSAYNKGKDEIKHSLEENKLFSLYRKASATKTAKELYPGVEIALEKHPTTWRPMIHGICPAVKCPEGRENKCSLCPYLITGKLFITGLCISSTICLQPFRENRLLLKKRRTKDMKIMQRSKRRRHALKRYLAIRRYLTESSMTWSRSVKKAAWFKARISQGGTESH